MAEHGNPFDPAHLIGHVKDAPYFEVPRAFASDGKAEIPQFRNTSEPIATIKTGFEPVDQLIEPFDGKITKFMVLEVVGALIVAVIFIWLAQKISSGRKPRGRLWNLFETMLLFIRDEVARPAIGHHDADRFLPVLWTMFFFVLICNLLGMVPWAGSPTGALATTGAMAIITFLVVIGGGMSKMGVVGFWAGQVPHMDLPLPLAIILKPMIFVLEVVGLLIRHFVLAVRLLANMMAGHLVLAVLVAFVAAVAKFGLAALLGVGAVSIFGAMALSLLELFVAFLQAYIFTFLSALFIGMAVHPH
jgi:F-type H+-transporting ATPase subunit a